MASVDSVDIVNEVEDPDVLLNPTTNEKLNKPFIGMVFPSIDEARCYYEEYAISTGFTIRKRSSCSTRRGPQLTRVTYTCSCEGVHKKKSDLDDGTTMKRNSLTMRTDCKAMFRIAWDRNTGKWFLSTFRDDHNHALVSLGKRLLLRSNTYAAVVARDLRENLAKENLQSSMVASVNGERFSNTGFDSGDCSNHLKTARHILEASDVQALLTYFRKKTTDNPHFFYAIQCDENGRATNFFWVDARSRMSYSHFGDVVTFDTTYKTYKYTMPIVFFWGLNHHNQLLLFGCALLQDETEDTFAWLFETWIEAMGGRHPITIVTNPDLAISTAIATIFPNTRHRFYLWHIKKLLAEKLSHVYVKKSKFKQAIKKCTRETYTVEDFKKEWASMLVEFGLEGNEWLKYLYDIREGWMPLFNRNTFVAGINTTQRSDIINSFFDEFLTSVTNVKDFIVKCEHAVAKIYINERKEDCISLCGKRSVNSEDLLLHHAAKTYTMNMFEKVQFEFNAACRFRAVEVENGDDKKFKVQSRVGNSEEFVVKMNERTKDGLCGCLLFEFMGIPCRHLFRVFDRLYVDEIPSHFIMKRWTKDVNRTEVIGSDGLLMHNRNLGSEEMQIIHYYRRSTQLAYMIGKSKEAYIVAMGFLDQAFEKVKLLDDVALRSENTDKPSSETCNSITDTTVLDAHVSQNEGKKRVEKEKDKAVDSSTSSGKGETEKSEGRRKPRNCIFCSGYGHDSHNCILKSKKARINNYDADLAKRDSKN